MKDFLIGILPFRVFLVKVKTASGYRRRLKLGILISRGMWLLLLPRDWSYGFSEFKGFDTGRYYGSWQEGADFFGRFQMKRYQVGYPDIDNLVKITNRYWLYNLLLWPFLCEPVWPGWYYWSKTDSNENSNYAWDAVRNYDGKKHRRRSAYLKTENNLFLGVVTAKDSSQET